MAELLEGGSRDCIGFGVSFCGGGVCFRGDGKMNAE